jgi:two-component system, NtrC family, sensor histidine kinase AtoS
MSADAPESGAAADEALARARDRLATVGFMAELIGHKARNRLASFRSVLELLQEGWEKNLSAEHRQSVFRQFEAFVGDFNFGLDLVRCDFGRNETFSVPEVADEAAAYFRARHPDVAISTEYGAGLKPVSADRRLLRLLLLNLLRNAVEVAPAGAAAKITVRGAPTATGVRIEVEDNGPGVAAALRGRLFHEPVTTREDGTGLGLLLCRDAATVLGGSIALVTPPGVPGACFRLELPAC